MTKDNLIPLLRKKEMLFVLLDIPSDKKKLRALLIGKEVAAAMLSNNDTFKTLKRRVHWSIPI